MFQRNLNKSKIKRWNPFAIFTIVRCEKLANNSLVNVCICIPQQILMYNKWKIENVTFWKKQTIQAIHGKMKLQIYANGDFMKRNGEICLTMRFCYSIFSSAIAIHFTLYVHLWIIISNSLHKLKYFISLFLPAIVYVWKSWNIRHIFSESIFHFILIFTW